MTAKLICRRRRRPHYDDDDGDATGYYSARRMRTHTSGNRTPPVRRRQLVSRRTIKLTDKKAAETESCPKHRPVPKQSSGMSGSVGRSVELQDGQEK